MWLLSKLCKCLINFQGLPHRHKAVFHSVEIPLANCFPPETFSARKFFVNFHFPRGNLYALKTFHFPAETDFKDFQNGGCEQDYVIEEEAFTAFTFEKT